MLLKPKIENPKLQRIIGYSFFIFCISLIIGCKGTNIPKNKPYIYDNKISLTNASALSNDDRAMLNEMLYDYIDDSLQVPVKYILGFKKIVNPPVFDSVYMAKTKVYFQNYLNSIGFYGASIRDTFKFDTVVKKQEIRVKTNFEINLGKNLRVDSVQYKFANNDLKLIADSAVKDAILSKDFAYSKDKIASELDRLASLYRKKGYLLISRSSLLAIGDTIDPSLVNLFNDDPITQLLQAQKRIEDPRITLEIMERDGVDSNVFRKFTIDSVIIYPDAKISDDQLTIMQNTNLRTFYTREGSKLLIREDGNYFSKRMLRRFNYLFPNRIYSDDNYFKTINGYSRLGTWDQVEARPVIKQTDTSSLVDFHIFLYPSKKHTFQVDLEGSQNNNISLSSSLSGRFLALGLILSERNRNFWGTATQSSTNARVGFELNNGRNREGDFIQTFVASVNQTFSIPRLLEPMSWIVKRRQDVSRTNLNFGASYTDRFNFYKQTGYNISMQYDWRKGKNAYSISIPNFESVSINETDSLRKELDRNPALLYAFTPGNILSVKTSWEHSFTFRNRNKNAYSRLGAEIAPFNFTILNKASFQFVKFDGLIVYNKTRLNTSWNFRAYGGVGWDISNNSRNATLPYFRQYVAGGSNSMRAWGLRQLGLGSSIVSDTSRFTDRFGDIQLEVNAEYRFNLARLFGFKISSAVFTDIGNIWNHKPNIDGYGDFNVKHLYRDLAMGVGTGLRIDFSYLIIRLDMGYKVKDPVRDTNGGWMDKLEWRSESTRTPGVRHNNVSFQFGIGYPF